MIHDYGDANCNRFIANNWYTTGILRRKSSKPGIQKVRSNLFVWSLQLSDQKGLRAETTRKPHGNRNNNNQTNCIQSANAMQTTWLLWPKQWHQQRHGLGPKFWLDATSKQNRRQPQIPQVHQRSFLKIKPISDDMFYRYHSAIIIISISIVMSQ